jgi:DNA (cytosine-5)-methyltransferase 1
LTAYYNEFDPFAAQWLRELIKAGAIAPGEVDGRSIVDVQPDDLKGFTQCHFFAGIGVWSHALRSAGWSDDRPVWTGSPPCQPFSSAGKRKGFEDERHLWPVFYDLLRECRPANFFGEQVASKDALAWLDPVYTDMERAGYAFGAVDLCAAGVGAPHIRQRLFMCGTLAHTDNPRLEGRRQPERGGPRELLAGPGGLAGGMVNTDRGGTGAFARGGCQIGEETTGDLRTNNGSAVSLRAGTTGRMADTTGIGWERRRSGETCDEPGTLERSERLRDVDRTGPTNGFWRDADWLGCRDGKWRPVEPGTFPLAHGAPARVGRLRGYGNAIVAPLAQAFIEAYLETEAVDVRPVIYDI